MNWGGGVSIDGTLLTATMIHSGIEHWSEPASGRSHQARWGMGPMKGVGAETKDAAGPALPGSSGLIDLVATLALISASAVVTWWAAGDLPYTGPSSLGTQQDYLIHPLNLGAGAEKLLGAVSVAVVVVAGAALLRAGSAPRRDPRWLAVLLPLRVTGIFVGGGVAGSDLRGCRRQHRRRPAHLLRWPAGGGCPRVVVDLQLATYSPVSAAPTNSSQPLSTRSRHLPDRQLATTDGDANAARALRAVALADQVCGYIRWGR